MKKPLIAVIDYEMGNLRSVSKALELVGARTIVTSSGRAIESADAAVFPGVGAFGPALKQIKNAGIYDSVLKTVDSGKPFLGLCLGFQMLFDSSSEGGKYSGMGVIPGKVVRFGGGMIVPHMGWNSITSVPAARKTMFRGIPDNSYFYFVHSYFGRPAEKDSVAGVTRYGSPFCSAVISGRVWGCQFHPEKSGKNGLRLLSNFINEVKKCS
jgi:imidazole glycerol-phosphate synthase subunit HisH